MTTCVTREISMLPPLGTNTDSVTEVFLLHPPRFLAHARFAFRRVA